MLAAERRQLILERLRRDGRVVAAELGGSLGVSHDTVRRDLRDLAEAGLLRRLHGGALPPVTVSANFWTRQRDAPTARLALARAAAELVRPGQVIILDAGTTNERLALELPAELEATIFTNAPPVAMALAPIRASTSTCSAGASTRPAWPQSAARRSKPSGGCAPISASSASAASIQSSASRATTAKRPTSSER